MPDTKTLPTSVPLRAWLSARGPFSQFRSSLLDAEARLNGYVASRTPGLWRAVHRAAGDERAMVGAVQALLAGQRLEVGIRVDDGAWSLVAVGETGREAAAAVALAALLDLGGPHRLKKCRTSGCGDVFLDWTNSAQRVGCRLHPTRPRPTASAD